MKHTRATPEEIEAARLRLPDPNTSAGRWYETAPRWGYGPTMLFENRAHYNSDGKYERVWVYVEDRSAINGFDDKAEPTLPDGERATTPTPKA